jgi:twitching motility two-component system response regulator PilG
VAQVQALAILNEGIAAAKMGNKVQARLLLGQAADLDPSSEATWLWLAGLAESPLESAHYLERVLALNPGHEKARSALRAARIQAGIAAARAGDKAQARLLLHRAIEHAPTSEIAWLWLASLAETAEKGAQHLETVLKINPNNERARAGLDRYRNECQTRPAEALAPNPAPCASPDPVPNPEEEQVNGQDCLDLDNVEQAGAGETMIEVEDDWKCPFCQATATAVAERCPGCAAILTLDHVESFFRPLHVDQAKINTAIKRLEQGDPTSDLATAWQLGLAYLNLKQFELGLDLLRTAAELQGAGSDLAARVEALVQYRNGLSQPRMVPKVKPKKTILAVDDSPTILKLVTMALERRGFATRTAGDGYEAIDMIRDWGVPDLILLDIAMPGMDGYQLCKLLRQNADTTNVPIILLSGKDGFFSKVRGQMAGSTEYITKPFDPESLLRVVERYCLPEPSAAGMRKQ